ncbi:hypothetical protein OEZ86_002718 [Tetradesmus obliquus]|nr:hypothetical protein OEZ86_002718 [Tetradesmus obliquus]
MGSNRGQLARAHERKEAVRQQQEFERAQIQKYYAQQRTTDAISGNMAKDEFKRHGREARERQAEQQLLEEMYVAEQQRELSAVAAAEADALAAALSRKMQMQEASSKEVQRLREESAELRELAEKIRAARVNKERSLQLQEKAALVAQEAEYDRVYDKVMMQQDSEGLAAQQAAEAARREAGKLGMQVLKQQMQERLELQRCAEAEFARERAMVDEVVARIQAEDRMELQSRRCKQAETKAYIENFLREQEDAKAAARAAARAEEQRIQDYWAMVAQRDAEEAARKAARKDAADRIYDQLRLEQEAALRAKEEEEYLIDLMHEEEMAEKRRHDAEAAAAKREASKREMMAANEAMLRLKAEREAAQRAEEEAFRQSMMAKFAEDDRLEQLKSQKRRLKVAEHKRAVDRMLEEKRERYEEARRAEEAEAAARQAAEAARAAIIADERRKLLLQAADLAEFLPPGAVKDRQELELMRQHAAAAAKQQQSGRF